MMSWTRLIVCIAILTESNTAQSNSTASMHPSKSSTEAGIPSANLTSDATARVVDGGMIGVGGGAINEKTRYYQPNNNTSGSGKGIIEGWNPSNNLGHMLHALVGLDRYPNYLGRFRDISDIDLLENALESKLSDVRRQRSEIIQKRVDIQQLVKRYTSSMTEFVEVSDDCPCSALWRDHPLLSPPKTWAELRERKMLTDHAFKVVHHSLLSIRNARTEESNKTAKADTKDESIELLSVGDIIDGRVQVQLTQSSLEDFMCQEMFDVYSFPLLTHEFCTLLRATLRNLSRLADSDEFAHLQLGRRPMDLDSIGLGWITDLLFNMFIHPISRHLFASTEKLAINGDVVDDDVLLSRVLDWRQGYVAGYSANPLESNGVQRHFLVPHTDDSEVTMNCCLGEDTFEGGNVEFHGLRGTTGEGLLVGTVHRPNVGTAVLHSGRHLHSVSNVLSGDRYALIIWSRSWGNLRSNTCPCCWMNRRQDSTCICGNRWN